MTTDPDFIEKQYIRIICIVFVSSLFFTIISFDPFFKTTKQLISDRKSMEANASDEAIDPSLKVCSFCRIAEYERDFAKDTLSYLAIMITDEKSLDVPSSHLRIIKNGRISWDSRYLTPYEIHKMNCSSNVFSAYCQAINLSIMQGINVNYLCNAKDYDLYKMNITLYANPGCKKIYDIIGNAQQWKKNMAIFCVSGGVCCFMLAVIMVFKRHNRQTIFSIKMYW